MPDDHAVKTKSFHELCSTEFPPDNLLIGDGLLPRDGLLFIGGPPKSYKSFLLNTIIYHLLTGTHLFGAHRRPHGREEMAMPVAHPCRVLLLEQEIGFQDTRSRLLPMWTSMTSDQQKWMGDNLFIHSRDHTMRLDDKVVGLPKLAAMIADIKPQVVCFDPFIEFHGANENDAQQMSMVMHNIDILRNTFNFATLITHHTGKPDPAKVRTGPDMLRGSSAIFGKGDAYLLLQPLDRDAGQLRCDFTIRRGKPIHPMDLVLDFTSCLARFSGWVRGKNKASDMAEGYVN